MEQIREKLVRYFGDTNIRIAECDKDKIRLSNKGETGVYINIKWEDIFYSFNIDNIEGVKVQFEKDTNALLIEFARKQIYSWSNKSLVVISQQTDDVKDKYLVGYFKDGYEEFEIEENNHYLKTIYNSGGCLNENLVNSFSIGDIDVSISKASDMFKLLFMYSSPYCHFGFGQGWENRITISLKNLPKSLNKNQLNSYLQEGMFFTNLYNPNFFTIGSSTLYQTESNYCNYDIIIHKGLPAAALYKDPICYYNEAKKSAKETCFYYQYKVLEFFFPVSRKEEAFHIMNEYDSIITDLNNSSLKMNKLEAFLNGNESNVDISNKERLYEILHDAITSRLENIYTNKEEVMLKILLNSKNIYERIKSVVDDYYYPEISVDKFCEKLYSIRNKIVHSKENTRKVPNLIDDGTTKIDSDLTFNDFNQAIERISLICIQYFCYSDKIHICTKNDSL